VGDLGDMAGFPPGKPPATRRASAVMAYGTILLLATVVVSLVVGHVQVAIAALVVGVPIIWKSRLAVVPSAAAMIWLLIHGEFLVFAGALPAFLSYPFPYFARGKWAYGVTDPDALRAAVDELPRSLINQIREEIGSRPLTTRDLLCLAAGSGDVSTSNWELKASQDPGPEAWDGPVLEPAMRGIVATKFACEACVLATKITETLDLRMNVRILGAAAASVFFSSAQEWTGRTFMSTGAADSLGVSLVQFSSLVTAFTSDPAGRDFGRRLETASMLNSELTGGLRSAVNEQIQKDLPRSLLATLSYWQVVRLQWRTLLHGPGAEAEGSPE